MWHALVRSVVAAALLAASLPAQALFHLWSIEEIFSNADGSVQYVKLAALAGSQQFIAGHTITSASPGMATRQYTFPANLPGDTTGRKFLVGTAGFAALGVVTPDYVVPDGFLFTAGGTVNFASVDIWNHGALPTDGTLALRRDGSTATNAPVNFAGATGQVAPPSHALTVSLAGAGSGTATSDPAGIGCPGTCAAAFAQGTVVTLSATPAAGSVFAGWSGEGCAGTGSCVVTMTAARSVTATFDAAVAPASLSATPPSLDFGGQSMNTTSPALAVTLANTSASPLSVTSVTASTGFAVTHDCATLAAGASCTSSVAFTPAAQGSFNGTLTVQASTGTLTVPLAGTGERSLVTHYYRAILRRAPDAAGKAFWDGEAARVQALGLGANEAWYAMSGSFFTSAEYLALARDDDGFVTDLYNTFFNRAPDAPGLAFWTGLLAGGMPREVLLASFMFSPEFVSFTQAIFGTAGVRAEVDTVTDFYRGLLARLPDNAGFAFWLARFRAAQCLGSAAVTAEAESISSQFALSAEYAARVRDNAQYVGDLYNAFLRRGGDLAGVLFWINELSSGARTRENVRQAFVASPEFQARVAAVIAQGCL